MPARRTAASSRAPRTTWPAGWRCSTPPTCRCWPTPPTALEELRADEDAVDAHLLAEAIASDPLMTLKLLAHVARLRRGRDGSDTETVTEALVMLGIPPFFRAFGPQTAVEDAAGRPARGAGGLSRRCCAARTARRASPSASPCTAWTTTRR